MPDTLASRFGMARSGPGPLVWGLDPSAALLREWGLGDDPDGLDRFADIMLAGLEMEAVGGAAPRSGDPDARRSQRIGQVLDLG